MTLEKARTKIIDRWCAEPNKWDRDDYITFFQSARSFYDNIYRNNQELLAFSCLGDKWQVVSRWIHEHEGYLHS